MPAKAKNQSQPPVQLVAGELVTFPVPVKAKTYHNPNSRNTGEICPVRPLWLIWDMLSVKIFLTHTHQRYFLFG